MPPLFMPPAIVLCAGRGERLRPFTDHLPKPLVRVQGQTVLDWILQALARGGITQVHINTAWLGEKIESHLGSTRTHRAWHELPESHPDPTIPCLQTLHYSREGQDFGHALETAGGIVRCLPQLGDVFWVVGGDVFCPQFHFCAQAVQAFCNSPYIAHIWLVPQPAHWQQDKLPGGFGISPEGLAILKPGTDTNNGTSESSNFSHGPGWGPLTYSTIGLYRPAFFDNTGIPPGNPQGIQAALGPCLRQAVAQGKVSASVYTGLWADIGTPARLAAVNAAPLKALGFLGLTEA